MQDYVRVGRLQEAQATVREARTKNVDSPYLGLYSYQLAIREARRDKNGGRSSSSRWEARSRRHAVSGQAETAAFSGHMLEARALSSQAIASAKRVGEQETAASYEAAAALREALFGNSDAARQHCESCSRLRKAAMCSFAALALAFVGELQQARQVSDQLSKEFPEDTLVKFNYLPAIKAQIALGLHDPARAVELLKAASTLELGVPGDAEFLPSLYPVYVPWQCILGSRQGQRRCSRVRKDP